MALIKCDECGKQISDKAKTCVNCGCPIQTKKDVIKFNNKDYKKLSNRERIELTNIMKRNGSFPNTENAICLVCGIFAFIFLFLFFASAGRIIWLFGLIISFGFEAWFGLNVKSQMKDYYINHIKDKEL